MATFKQALEDYSECPEDVYLVLQKVLEIEEVQSLAGIKFRCLFFTKPKFKNGEKVWAETRVLSTRNSAKHCCSTNCATCGCLRMAS